MLSEQEVEVLGRYRTSDYSKFKGNLDLAQIMRDQEHLCRAMLRLYPPGWNDPVTPERLVELGGSESPTGISFELYGDVMYGGVPVRFEFRQSGLEVRVPSRKWLPAEAKPRNMQEARRLLERCGAFKEAT